MHPSQVLFPGAQQPASLPVCDHYAGSEKLMRKSIALQQELGPVFDITLDCEDGAAAGNEAEHAQLVASLVNGPDNRHRRIGVRVHDVGSPHFEQDVSIICSSAARELAFVMLPKPEGVNDVVRALESINRVCLAAGRHALPLHVLIETHGALADVWKIAALPQVESLSFGVMDFVSAHYGAIPSAAMRSPGQFDHPLVRRAKLEISAACHAHGKVPSHNVTTDIKNPAAVADDARRAAQEFGYTRMWSIHPDQIRPIVQSMSPSTEEADQAAQILLKAQAVQWGPIQHQGNLHDRASYRYFWSILQRAHATGVALPPEAASWFAGSDSPSTSP
ncbi:HpcH/HpaI aldolase/citrate lyase family protein [Herbaspirillum robiniae]|uniref:CoA ester lyase n=1 Tax=Herbaspirillum robiniae TaxID=2014887 RepID=A0ABX2LWM9_9BURK|nr:aldolase/citrate lyase family protein [Herbaspirillum robiniae]NUU02885.1 CoA ester lyase [Herbaspirillum robiniae]